MKWKHWLVSGLSSTAWGIPYFTIQAVGGIILAVHITLNQSIVYLHFVCALFFSPLAIF